MDEQKYDRLLFETFRHIEDAFEEIDPDVAEAIAANDTLTVLFRDGVRLVLTPQRPLHQLWVATKAHGYRFRWDDDGARWLEESGRAGALYDLVRAETARHAGIEVTL